MPCRLFYVFYDRKLSMPRIMSMVNGIYKSEKPEDDELYLHEVTEYSEIPDLEVRFSHKLYYKVYRISYFLVVLLFYKQHSITVTGLLNFV